MHVILRAFLTTAFQYIKLNFVYQLNLLCVIENGKIKNKNQGY